VPCRPSLKVPALGGISQPFQFKQHDSSATAEHSYFLLTVASLPYLDPASIYPSIYQYINISASPETITLINIFYKSVKNTTQNKNRLSFCLSAI